MQAIQNQGEIKTIKKYASNDRDSPLISKRNGIFNKLVHERLEEITKLDEKVNPNDLLYKYKGPTPYPGEIRRLNKKHMPKDKKKILYNIEILYKERNDVIKFYDDYSSRVSVAKHEITEGTGLKILTPKQMFQ